MFEKPSLIMNRVWECRVHELFPSNIYMCRGDAYISMFQFVIKQVIRMCI